MCSKMYWKLSVHIERIPYCAVSVHQETQGLHLPTAFPKENPRALSMVGRTQGTCYYAALPNGILECLAGLENRYLAGGVGHGFAGAGIASYAGGTRLRLEGAKAHQLHLVSALHGGFHRAGKGGEGRFAVLLRQAADFRHGGDQFSFVHGNRSPSHL